MADTHGFQTVVEANGAVIKKVLQAAWKSADCPDDPGDESRIPENIDIPPPDVSFGSYEVLDGQIQLPQDELDARLVAGVGTDLDFGLHIQFEIKDPPVPSAQLFDMQAKVTARSPIATGDDGKQVFVFLDRITRADVHASLTSGDPLTPKLDQMLGEFVHKAYENGGATPPDPSFPALLHVLDQPDQSISTPVGNLLFDAYAELYDDASDPAHRIQVDRPDPATLRISIPMYLRIYNMTTTGLLSTLGLRSPMGIETRLIISAPFESTPGSYKARMTAATVTVGAITPSPFPPEGANYTHNKGAIPIVNLDTLLTTKLVEQGKAMATAFGDFTIDVPTVAEIETAIGDLFHANLIGRGAMPVWTPTDDENFTIDNVTTNVTANALVIAINSGDGADVTAMDNFIPAGRELAIAVNGAKVLELVDIALDDSDMGDDDLPKRMEADGKDVDLRSLDVGLADGFLRINGSVTVIDAILGSIDVDADFESHVGLHWEPSGSLNGDGEQAIKHHEIGEPDVDTDIGWLLWLILGLIGLATGGLLGVLIGIIIGLVISAIASSIGSSVVSDTTSGLPVGLGGWPSKLTRVGTARAIFNDPVTIEVSGIVISGEIEVISSCEDTAIVPADSGSSYSGTASASLVLSAANTHVDAVYGWLAGDGSPSVAAATVNHTYIASGLYLAKHRLEVAQFGGATTRHFATVDVANVIPTVDAGADIVVNEGEVVTLIGHFWDVEYPDTHESAWNFGDDSKPEAGVIVESNTAPQASGTTTVTHAWCDNGVYVVTLRVRDQNGGMAIDTRTVTVLNVPPEVEAGPPIYAYPCMPVTLLADFRDPGWCDTHTATWDAGDCAPVQTAVVRETNSAPAAIGTASVMHIYKKCGDYRALATVTDDDGGVDSDCKTVHVVVVGNADFEGGYWPSAVGRVANAWQPYGATTATAAAVGRLDASRQFYSCEECVVHGGQRSQRITAPAGVRIGIWQKLGANRGWKYQVSAFYALQMGLGGQARLGIDPEGGIDPASTNIVWANGAATGEWEQLREEVISLSSEAITIFLECSAEEGQVVDAFFDDVDFVAEEPQCPPADLPEPCDAVRQCVTFDRRPPASTYAKDGFIFRNRSGQPVTIATWGDPQGQMKLALTPGGLEARLPFPATSVRATVVYGGGKPPSLAAFDGNGGVLATTVGDSQHPQQTLTVEAIDIASVLITAEEGALYELCATRGDCPRDPDVVTTVGAIDMPSLGSAVTTPQGMTMSNDDHDNSKLDPKLQALLAQASPQASPQSGQKSGQKSGQQSGQQSGRQVGDVDVMVVTTADEPTRAPVPATQRAAEFVAATQSLVRHLEQVGARDVTSLWISRSISARLPVTKVTELAQRDDIERIELVTSITATADPSTAATPVATNTPDRPKKGPCKCQH